MKKKKLINSSFEKNSLFLYVLVALLLITSFVLFFILLDIKINLFNLFTYNQNLNLSDIFIFSKTFKLFMSAFFLIISFVYLKKIKPLNNIFQIIYYSLILKIILKFIEYVDISYMNFNFNFYIYIFISILLLCSLIFSKKTERFNKLILFIFLFFFWYIAFELLFYISFFNYFSLFPVAAPAFLINYLDLLDFNFTATAQQSAYSDIDTKQPITFSVEEKYWKWGQGSKFYKPNALLQKLSTEKINLDQAINNFVKNSNWVNNNGYPDNLYLITKYKEGNLINLSQFNSLYEYLINNNSLNKFNCPNLQQEFYYLLPRGGGKYLYWYMSINKSWVIINNQIFIKEDLAKDCFDHFSQININIDKENYLLLNIEEDFNNLFIKNPTPLIEVNLNSLKDNTNIHPQVKYFSLKEKSNEISTSKDKYIPFLTINDFINYSQNVKNIVKKFESNNEIITIINSKLIKAFKPYLELEHIKNYINKYHVIWTHKYSSTSYFLNSSTYIYWNINKLPNLYNLNLDKFEASKLNQLIDFKDELNILNKALIGLEHFLGIKYYNITEAELNECKIIFFKFWLNQIHCFYNSSDLFDKDSTYVLNWFDINIIYSELLENILFTQCKIMEAYWCLNIIHETKLNGFTERGLPFNLINTPTVEENLKNFYNDLFLKFQLEIINKYQRAYDVRLEWVLFKTFNNATLSNYIWYTKFIKLQEINLSFDALLIEEDLSKKPKFFVNVIAEDIPKKKK